MKRFVAVLLALAIVMVAAMSVSAQDVKTITYYMRYDSANENVVARMNMIMNGFKKLEEQDPSVHFEFDLGPKLEVKDLALQFNAGVPIDLFFDEETAVGLLFDGGIIQPVDWFLELPNVKGNLFDSVVELGYYNGIYYGVPIDLAVNMVYANKDALKQLGWTDEEIAAWPEKVAVGEWTIDDMIAVCKEAIDKGIVKNGFMLDGIDNAACASIQGAFDFSNYDRENNKLIFDKEGYKRVYEFFDRAVNQEGVIPVSLPGYDGTYLSFYNFEDLFFTDVSGYEWMQRNSEMSQEDWAAYYEEHFTQALQPSATKGVHAQALMKMRSMFVTTQVEGEKLEYLKQALNLAYVPENMVEESKYFGKLNVMKTMYDLPEVQEFKFLVDTAYMAEYGNMRSPHPDFNSKFHKYFRNQIEAIIVDKITPDEAVEAFEADVRFNIEDSEIIYK